MWAKGVPVFIFSLPGGSARSSAPVSYSTALGFMKCWCRQHKCRKVQGTSLLRHIGTLFWVLQDCQWPRAKISENASIETEVLMLLNENMCNQSFPISHRTSHLSVHGNIKLQWRAIFFKNERNMRFKLYGSIAAHFLSFMSIENDIVESLTFGDLISDFAFKKLA